MAVRDDRSDVKQTTAGFRGPLMVQSLTSAKSKFLSLSLIPKRKNVSVCTLLTFTLLQMCRWKPPYSYVLQAFYTYQYPADQ